MLTHKQIEEFRELLDKAQNPLFFFDNDIDGLTSFLLLRRFCSKGKGIAIKSYPGLDVNYVSKLHEFKPDYIFILDKPIIAKEFIEETKNMNIVTVWLDHHPINDIDPMIHYFNPLQNKPETNEPVAYWCYKIVNKKEDEWLAMLGCISDWFIPDFSEDFAKHNSNIFTDTKNPAQALYGTELGRICKVLSFALKDRTSNVVKMLRILIDTKDINELSEENKKNSSIFKRFKQVNKKYEKLLEKAKQIGQEITRKNQRILFFQYGGLLSLSGELANEIVYNFPGKMIVVAYIKGIKVNCSIRGKKARELIAKALEGIESTSGGHEDACGATLQVEDLPKFRDNLIKLLR